MSEEKLPNLHIQGFRVSKAYKGDNVRYSVIYQNDIGEKVSESPVLINVPEYSSTKSVHRAVYALQAICDYFNTSGEKDLNFLNLEKLLAFVTTTEVPQRSLDWKIQHSDEDEDLYYNNTTDQYLRIVKDEFTEILTREEYLEMLTGRKTVTV